MVAATQRRWQARPLLVVCLVAMTATGSFLAGRASSARSPSLIDDERTLGREYAQPVRFHFSPYQSATRRGCGGGLYSRRLQDVTE